MPTFDELYQQIAAGASKPTQVRTSTRGPVDQMAVDDRYIQQVRPQGYQEMGAADKFFKTAGDIGEAIYGLSGFSPNWQKTKEDFANGTLSAGQALKTAGSFLLSLPLGMASAPFSGAEKLYEAATGRPTQEAIDGTNWIPDYTLDAEQKGAAAVDAAIDIGGLLLGGTGSVLRGVGGTLRGVKTAGQAFSDARRFKPFAGAFSGTQKAELEAAKAAGKSADEIAKLEKAYRKAARPEVAIGLGYDMAEEGAEEYAQSMLEDIRGTQEQHGREYIDQDKAIEAAILGAVGGLVFGGFSEAVSRVVEKVSQDSITAAATAKKHQLDGSIFDSVKQTDNSVLATFAQELAQKQAGLKTEPGSGMGVGQMWVPPRGHTPAATSMGIDNLISTWLNEGDNGPLHQFFQHFRYNNLTFEQMIDGSAARAAQTSAEAWAEAFEQEKKAMTESVNSYIEAQAAKGNRLRMALGKNPGDKIAYIDSYVAQVNEGAAFYVSNPLAVSIQADVDGDNYIWFFMTPDGKDAAGNDMKVGSVWQSIAEMSSGNFSYTGTDLEDVIKDNIYKAQAQLGLRTDITANKEMLKGLWNGLSDTAKSTISRESWSDIVDNIIDAAALPSNSDIVTKALDELAKPKFKNGPRDIFTLLGYVYNNTVSDKEATISGVWDTLISRVQDNFDATNLISGIEKAKDVAVKTAEVSAKIDAYENVHEFGKNTPQIKQIVTGGKDDSESLIKRIVHMFGAPQLVYDSPTRANLTFYQMTKNVVSRAVAICNKPGIDPDVLMANSVETALELLVRDNLRIPERGEHAMQFAAAMARRFAFSKALAESENLNWSSTNDIINWCNETLSKYWDIEHARWETVKTKVFGSQQLFSDDVSLFPKWNNDDALYNFYNCQSEARISSIFKNSKTNETLGSQVAKYMSTNSRSGIGLPEEADVLTFVSNISKALTAKNKATQARMLKTLQMHLDDSKETIDAVVKANYDLDKIVEQGNLKAINQVLNGIGGITRKGDLTDVGFWSVDSILAAAKSENDSFLRQIARALLSSNADTVANAASSLAAYVQFRKPILEPNQDGKIVFKESALTLSLDAILDNKTTLDDKREAASDMLYQLTKIYKASPLYSKIALHYAARLSDITEGEGSFNVEEAQSIARDMNRAFDLFADVNVSMSRKQEFAGRLLGMTNYDTYWIESISKERDLDDITTPSSRAANFETYFNNAAMLNQEFMKANGKQFMEYANQHADTIDADLGRLGLLHEAELESGAEGVFAVCANNIERGLLSRWRKTENTPSSGIAFKAASRAKMGIVPSEFANIAYMGGTIDWQYIEESPSILGVMLFTDWVKEHFSGSGLKIVMPDGSIWHIKSKADLVRYMLPEDVAAEYVPDGSDEGFKWQPRILSAMLEYNPSIINIINPITYSHVDINETDVESSSHRFTISGWQFDTQNEEMSPAGRRERNLGRCLFNHTAAANMENLVRQEADAKIRNAMFCNRGGLFLLTAKIKKGLFDGTASFDSVEREVSRSATFWTAMAKYYASQSKERQKEIEDQLVSSTYRGYYRRGQDRLRQDRTVDFYQSIKNTINLQSAKIDVASTELALDSIYGMNGALISDMGYTDLVSVASRILGFKQKNDKFEAEIENIKKAAEHATDRISTFFDQNSELVDGMLAMSVLARIDGSTGSMGGIGKNSLVNKQIEFFNETIESVQAQIDEFNSYLNNDEEFKKFIQTIMTTVPAGNEQQGEAVLRQVIKNNIEILTKYKDFLGEISGVLLSSTEIRAAVAQGSSNIRSLLGFGRLQNIIDNTDFDEMAKITRDVENRYGKINETISAASAGLKTTSPVTVKKLDDLRKREAERATLNEKQIEKLDKDILDFKRKLLVGYIQSRGIEIQNAADLRSQIHSMLTAGAEQIGDIDGTYRSEAENKIIDDFTSGQLDVDLSVTSPEQRLFMQNFIAEVTSGNAGTGVSLNARVRPAVLATNDLPKNIMLGGVSNKQNDIWAAGSWAGRKMSEVYDAYAALDDDEKEFFVGSVKIGDRSIIVNPRMVEEWKDSDEVIDGLYLVGSHNAGFDWRYEIPSLTGNPGYRGYQYLLGQFLIQCAEAMNLKSKKQSDMFKETSYALEDPEARRQVQELAVLSPEDLTNLDGLLDKIRKFKVTYSEKLFDLYGNGDKAHKELWFSKPMWMMLANHQVQKIMVKTKDGKIFSIAVKDIVDGNLENNPVYSNIIQDLGQVSSAWIDVMSIEEVGKNLSMGIAEQVGRGMFTKQGVQDSAALRRINKMHQDAAVDALNKMRVPKQENQATRQAIKTALSGVVVKSHSYRLLETADLRDSYASNSQHLFKVTSNKNAYDIEQFSNHLYERVTGQHVDSSSNMKAPIFVDIVGNYTGSSIKGSNLIDTVRDAGIEIAKDWKKRRLTGEFSHPLAIFVSENATDREVMSAIKTARDTGVQIYFQNSSILTGTKDLSVLGAERTELKRYGEGWLLSVKRAAYLNRPVFYAPRRQLGQMLTLGIYSPVVPAQDGHGEMKSGSKYYAIAQNSNDDFVTNGEVVLPSEIVKMINETEEKFPGANETIDSAFLDRFNIVLDDEGFNTQDGITIQKAYLRPITNYIACLKTLAEKKIGEATNLTIPSFGGFACVGFNRTQDGSLHPIIKGPYPDGGMLDITYRSDGAPNVINVKNTVDTSDSLERGHTQKIFVQLGGVKVEVNMPSAINKEMSAADMHEFFAKDAQQYELGEMQVVYMDSKNNGGKTPDARISNWALFYNWMKNVNNQYSLWLNSDGSLRIDKIVNNAGLEAETLQRLFTDTEANEELIQRILNGEIEFNFFGNNYAKNAQFSRAIKSFAHQSLVCNIPLIEMFANFTTKNGNIYKWSTVPDSLSCLPDEVLMNDYALIFNAISDDLVMSDEWNPANPPKKLARFLADGQILQYVNGEAVYCPATLEWADMDTRNSMYDEFQNRVKIGEKPTTLLSLFNGMDPNANYDALRAEAALASGNNLAQVYKYYKDRPGSLPSELGITQNGDKTLSAVASSKKRAALAGMKALIGNDRPSDYDNFIATLHGMNKRQIADKFLTYRIKRYTASGDTDSIWTNQNLVRLRDDIKTYFRTENWTQRETEGFNDWVESLIKRALGYAPNAGNLSGQRDTFTDEQLSRAAEFIRDSIKNGKLFDMNLLGEGQTNYILLLEKTEPRYIVPIVMDEDRHWVNMMTKGESFETQRKQSAENCNTLMDVLSESKTKKTQEKAILNMIDALSGDLYSSEELNVAYAKSEEYLYTLLRDNEDIILEMSTGADIETVKRLSKETQEILKNRLDKQFNRGLRSVESPVFLDGKEALETAQMDQGLARVANNLCEMSKIMRIAEPMLLPASVLERQVYSRPVRFAMVNGMLGRISPYQSNLLEKAGGKQGVGRIISMARSLSKTQEVKRVFDQFKLLNMYGTTDFMLQELSNQTDIAAYLASKKNDSNLAERISNTMYDWAAGKGIGSSVQVELFFDNLIRLMSLDSSYNYYFQLVGEGKEKVTRIEQMILNGPERFFLECFATDSPLNFVAKQAYNVALQGDAAAKTVWSILYYETCAQHPVFRVFNTVFFSPFVQYGINIANRHLNSIAPISTLNYLLVSLGSKSDLTIPWLTTRGGDKMRLKDLNLEDAQVAASLKEAIQIDLSRMGTMMFAMMLVAMTGALEPPEDDDKWGNIDEWTIFGNRIQANWWIQDVMGPALGYAAAMTALLRGKPCPSVFYGSLADCLYCDPLMRASDGLDLIFNPYGQYTEDYLNDIDRFAGSIDGEPTALQVLGANVGVTALSTLFSFITPAILRDIYRESQVYEVSYKNVYKTDEYGNVVYKDNGQPLGTEKTTYWDAKIRQQTRNNPFFALAMDAIRAIQGGKGTGYFASEMPRTVYYDPYQLDSYKALSMYYYDENGLMQEKPEQEKQAIAMGIISELLSAGNMDDLVASGFCMPYETMLYVGDVIWDIYYAQKELYYEWQKTGQLDVMLLGGGDYNLGKATLDGINNEFDNLYKFWSDVYYNKLWSEQMKAGIQKYNRWATSYEMDANGEYYATGFRRGLQNLFMPWRTADGTLTNPGPTMGWENDWDTASVITGESLSGRVLVPVDDIYIKTPDFDSLGGGNGNDWSKSYPKYMSSYGGGGGGGISLPRTPVPNISSLPRLKSPDVTSSYGRPVSNVSLDNYYIRPGFETKGSRKAYKREDI